MKQLFMLIGNIPGFPETPVESTKNVDSTGVYLQGLADQLVNQPEQFFENLIQEAIDFGLKVVAALVIYAIGAWLVRRINKWLDRRLEKRNAEKTVASFTKSVVSITLTALLLIITIGTLGVNTSSLAALLAAGGMAIGMALSGTVQNFAGGLMILMFKPFQVGDYIKAQGYEGFVTAVTIVNTKIRTYDNSVIILPNGTLFNGNIDNFSDNPEHRITFNVDVSYGSDSDKVVEVLKKVATDDPRVLSSEDPGAKDPAVYLNKMKDSSIEFIMYIWVKTEDYWPVKYGLQKKIYDELPKNGITFPFPQMDIHIKENNQS